QRMINTRDGHTTGDAVTPKDRRRIDIPTTRGRRHSRNDDAKERAQKSTTQRERAVWVRTRMLMHRRVQKWVAEVRLREQAAANQRLRRSVCRRLSVAATQAIAASSHRTI